MAANATTLTPDYIGMVNQQIAQNNSFSAEQAMKQMQFQERMSNTAHQREVKDLKAAGLNPVLSANQGASTPSGASASADPGATSALVNMLGTMIQTESDNAKAKLQAETSKANAKLRSESSAKALESKDWKENILLQYLLAMTGQQGKSAAEIAADAAENTKAAAKKAGEAAKKGASKAAETVTNVAKDVVNAGISALAKVGNTGKDIAQGVKSATISSDIPELKSFIKANSGTKVTKTVTKGGKQFTSRIKQTK